MPPIIASEPLAVNNYFQMAPDVAVQPYLFGYDEPWVEVRDGDLSGYAIYRRHYSARRYRVQRQRLFVGPGYKLVLLTPAADALFVWRRFRDDSGQSG
jgi:hypothetical protein